MANGFSQICIVAAAMTKQELKVDIVTQEQRDTKEFKNKNISGKFPLLETADGSVIFETTAICKYFARLSPGQNLLGATPIERA